MGFGTNRAAINPFLNLRPTRMGLRWVVPITVLMVGSLTLLPSRDQAGIPLENLPDNIRKVAGFGERAAWSPDGKRLIFVHKTLGDAFEYDLATGRLRCLTCAFRHAGYFRVQYLPSGDYFLIGPPEVGDVEKVRWEEAEMWILKAGLTSPPVRLNRRISEGVAISRQAPRIGWVISSRQYPDRIGEGVTQLWLAEIGEVGNETKLINARKVHEDRWPHCWLEAQDFRLDDSELIFSCYQPDDKAEVMGVELQSGRVTNYSNSPDVYDEPEGIFPDGEYTLVESDKHTGRGDSYIDIWKLQLDGTGKDFTRLTFFTDYAGYKASNPVVSPDGKRMAFQVAKSTDPPGVGYAILLFEFPDPKH